MEELKNWLIAIYVPDIFFLFVYEKILLWSECIFNKWRDVRHCKDIFMFLYYRAANKTHACIELMTRDCNPLQRAPISYVFRNVLSRDPKLCGIPTTPTPELVKDPMFKLAICSTNYSMAVQQAFSKPPTKTMSLEMCAAAVMLDQCVYHTDVSSAAKVPVAQMAMVTKALVDVSCNSLSAG